MPLVGLELTTPVFERAKTVHALDCTATVIGYHKTIENSLMTMYVTTVIDVV
jgi:hypothetical protein